MALASVCLTIWPYQSAELINTLRQFSQVTDIQELNNCKIALVIEETADKLTGLLKRISDLSAVTSLDLIFVNYENDRDHTGHMPLPPEALD